jgi:hypothetical protein
MKITSAALIFFLANFPFWDVSALFLQALTQPAMRSSERSQSSLYLSSQSESHAESLLHMAAGRSNDEFSSEVGTQLHEIEQTPTSFVKEQLEESPQPRPPGIPPPLHILQSLDTGSSQEASFVKAEVTQEKLRPRLRVEPEGHQQVALIEEDILRRAEDTLQRSKAAAKKRTLEAIRKEKQASPASEMGLQSRADLEGTHVANDVYDPSGELSSRGLQAPRNTIPLVALSGSSAPTIRGRTPSGDGISQSIPTLSNWIQCADGSVRGMVYNSDRYPDGAEISTSTVPHGVTGGTTIETSSGSRYFLEGQLKDGALRDLQQNNDDVLNYSASPGAPFGVPSILAWKVLDNGAIAGILHDCVGANNGDYVETSPIATGVRESGQVVVTESGSQYFLSPLEDGRMSNIVAAFQGMSRAAHGSTITLNKELGRRSIRDSDGASDAPYSSKQPRRRPTFSLFDLMGKKRQRRRGGATGPDGLPMLTKWKVNPDKTITGSVSGSPRLNDGDVVTTSEVVAGLPKQFGKVTTASGTTYYLA